MARERQYGRDSKEAGDNRNDGIPEKQGNLDQKRREDIENEPKEGSRPGYDPADDASAAGTDEQGDAGKAQREVDKISEEWRTERDQKEIDKLSKEYEENQKNVRKKANEIESEGQE